ncbi:ATP-dependent RNA helicase DDX60 [Pancytospora philotis]|nr:ATP-dependent RNA helicase DDX60 [Pancytospora philotis]
MHSGVANSDRKIREYTNITATFTGIGYVVIDVNGLVLSVEKLYRVLLRELPLQTVLGHFRYVVQNLAVSLLSDVRLYCEPSSDPWTDYLVRALDDGSFISFSDLDRAVREDRIALLLSYDRREELVAYAHSVGLYVGMLDTLAFEVPYAYCHVLGPSEVLSATARYECLSAEQPSFTRVDVGEFLGREGFTVESMAEAVLDADEWEFETPANEVERDFVCSLIAYRHSTVRPNGVVYFDSRIYYGARKAAQSAAPADRSILESAPDRPWSGKDLDTIMPPIPARPNLKHLANIRKSALSMYDQVFHYSTIPENRGDAKPAQKVSAKMQKIMDENAARIRAEKEKSANSWLRGFYTNYSKLNTLAAKKSYIESISIQNSYITNRLSLLKVELYMDLWKLEQLNKTVDERVLVPLYLSCLSFITSNCALRCAASESGKKKKNAKAQLELDSSVDAAELEFVMTKLVEAGFEATARELIEKYEMPPFELPYKTKATAAPNDVDLYFQLKYAGDHLKRTLGTRKDTRVPFDPDRWQAELLDAVDANKSAIVSAPTSCGKTFICFYAIEKILRSSDTDMVVFCLPTKALANQVSADIYARFSPKTCRMALQGTLMADRCLEPFNCQVLITIPCMLESWLASRNCDNIKYIIMDEVHKINDESIGLSIERIIHMAACPMLLLSATIGNLDGFYDWFNGIEKEKGRECALVTHRERYCELKPYVFQGKEGDSNADLTSAFSTLAVSDSIAVSEEAPHAVSPDSSPDAPKLLPLNCMFAYSFSHLKEFGFGNDINFLPEELLNLYYYIYIVLSDEHKKLIKKLAPKKFFKSNIITKADTREYQHHLLAIFEQWVQQGILSETQVKEVYNMLVGNTMDAFPLVSTEQYLVNNMLDLLNSLKSSDMLPVIVFNMDRELVTRLAKAVYQELESLDQRKKKDKLLEKMKKESKRTRDAEKTRDSWIEESIMSEQSLEPEARDIKYTFLDQTTKLSDAEVREELSEVRNTPKFITDMAYRGIGIHHAGMGRKYRSAIEILFRKKHVRVLFATETLALGINMPCRTVVFAGDSLALDPMNYKQMAGRAGRRGYDTLGNIVFMGIPRSRVQNLMVSMLPQVQGSYTYSNTSLVSFGIESSLVRHPLLGTSFGSGLESLAQKDAAYVFKALGSEEARGALVKEQKAVYPFIYPSNYLWDFFIPNRNGDPAVFIFGLMLDRGVVPWDQSGFMRTVAHLFETRPAVPDCVLEPLQQQQDEFLRHINAVYAEDIRKFYSPQLRTLSNQRREAPLHYVRSFLFYRTEQKNSYVCDFFQHGSSTRIAVRNHIPGGQLWQSLYNIDCMLSSLMKLLESVYGETDDRLRKLRLIYANFHSKFEGIFA